MVRVRIIDLATKYLEKKERMFYCWSVLYDNVTTSGKKQPKLSKEFEEAMSDYTDFARKEVDFCE